MEREEQEPQDAVSFMERARGTAYVVAAVTAVVLAWLAVSSFDYADQLEAEAVAKAERAARAGAELDFPLPYTFSAQDCLPSGRACSQTRFYIPTVAR